MLEASCFINRAAHDLRFVIDIDRKYLLVTEAVEDHRFDVCDGLCGKQNS